MAGSSHSVCVALGKFDAMHIGHRLLSEEATKLDGYPCMMQFSGLAKVTLLFSLWRFTAMNCLWHPRIHTNVQMPAHVARGLCSE